MSLRAAESLSTVGKHRGKDASATLVQILILTAACNEKKNPPPKSDNVSKFHLGQKTLRGRARGVLITTCESIQRHTFGLILN